MIDETDQQEIWYTSNAETIYHTPESFSIIYTYASKPTFLSSIKRPDLGFLNTLGHSHVHTEWGFQDLSLLGERY